MENHSLKYSDIAILRHIALSRPLGVSDREALSRLSRRALITSNRGRIELTQEGERLLSGMETWAVPKSEWVTPAHRPLLSAA